MAPLTRLQWLVRLRSLLALCCFIVPGLWAWTYSGPFRWLSRVELRLFGDEHDLINYLLCVLGLLFLLLMPLAMHISLFSRRHQLDDALEQLQQQQAASGRQAQHWVAHHRLLIIGATLLLVGGGIGAHFWWRGSQAGTLQALDWSHLAETGSGRRVAITAHADSRRYWVSERNGLRSYWVVLRPPHAEGQSVQLLGKLSDRSDVQRLGGADDAELVGIIDDAPTGRFLAELRQSGLALDETLRVLDMTETPTSLTTLGQIFTALFGGSGLLCLALDAWLSHRRKQTGR